LDPFAGTGVTCLEAALLKRRSVGVDINPLANIISNSYYFDINENLIEENYAYISGKCERRINELYGLSEKGLRKKRAPYWYPKGVRLPKSSDVPLIEDLFTKRNLIALSILKHEIDLIENEEVRRFFSLVFSRILARASKTYAYDTKKEGGGDSSIFRVFRIWVPEKPDERNVFGLFKNSYIRVRKRVLESSKLLSNNPKPLIIMGNAQEVPLRNETVDYVYTDPPYGANITYLDLSTIWSAWFRYDITDEIKRLEIIENGDIDKTKEEYETDLAAVFPEMFRVLKYDKYVSFVFAHKDVGFWDTIIKAAERSGFEYVNTVVQPWQRPSFHKINNPLKVLSGQLIINFRKVKNPRSIAITALGHEPIELIKNSAELTIVRNNGATTEAIYNELIPKLLENGLLGTVRKDISDITPLLSEIFDFETTDNKWYIRKDSKIGSFIPLKDRIRFYIIDLLKYKERLREPVNTDEVILSVMPKLINGDQPANQDILKELDRVAYSEDGVHWALKRENEQTYLGFLKEETSTFLPVLQNKTEAQLEHNEVIYRLCKLGYSVGVNAYIGKRERSQTWLGESLGSLSVPTLPFADKTDTFSRKKVEQIDCVWLDSNSEPLIAFEVEHTTSINSAIERFIEILKSYPSLAKKCVVVCPSKREKKINEVLTESHFVGAPLYMENKIVYLFYKDLLSIYNYFVDNRPEKPELFLRLTDKFRYPTLTR